MLFFLLTGRSDEISVNYLNHFYDCVLCGKKRECAGWCLPGITAILFCAQWWNRLPVERGASQLTSHSWTLSVTHQPAVFGWWPGKACPLFSLSTAASIYVAAPLTGSLCRIPRAAIRWLLHSSTGIRGNNPYHTLHIRDTAVKCLAERARQFAL